MLRPTATTNNVAPSHPIDSIPGAKPLMSSLEPSTEVELSKSHHKANSNALTALKWFSNHWVSSSKTAASQTAITDINATSPSNLDRETSFQSQKPQSLLRNLNTSSAANASGPTPVLNSSYEATSGQGDNFSHGPLPKWAYFYDPALTHAQVKYIESQMRSQEEYKKVPPDQRQCAVVKDLQQALSSMGLAYSRPANVGNSTTDDMDHQTTSPTATTTEAIIQSAHNSAQALRVDDAILAGQTHKSVVIQNLVSAEMQRGNQASTDPSSKISASAAPTLSSQTMNKSTTNFQTKEIEKMPIVAAHDVPSQIGTTNPLFALPLDASPQRSRGKPVHDISVLNGRSLHVKRVANGEEVVSKRQRIQLAPLIDRNGPASIFSTTHEPRPAVAPLSPEVPPQADSAEKLVDLTHAEVLTESYPPRLSSLDSSPSAEVSSDDDADSQKVSDGPSWGRKWPQEDVTRLVNARADGQPWEFIMQVSWWLLI